VYGVVTGNAYGAQCIVGALKSRGNGTHSGERILVFGWSLLSFKPAWQGRDNDSLSKSHLCPYKV
jgi:hypothetical protein